MIENKILTDKYIANVSETFFYEDRMRVAHLIELAYCYLLEDAYCAVEGVILLLDDVLKLMEECVQPEGKSLALTGRHCFADYTAADLKRFLALHQAMSYFIAFKLEKTVDHIRAQEDKTPSEEFTTIVKFFEMLFNVPSVDIAGKREEADALIQELKGFCTA